jgi:tRNA A-37 threonylcarbamoyl transferase component Bud32
MITDGRLLAGRYRLEQLVGRGGMAQVHRAIDLVLGRPVAVKIMAEQLTRDPVFVERFRREAQAAAGLNHPGIVAVFDTGADGDLHYIVMELVEGRTLGGVLRDGPIPLDRALEIAEDVCSAIGVGHAKALVHRDVKPGNVMVTPSGSVKVMDFGIARAASADTLTHTAALLGTATYLSPEQASGAPVDPRSDVYSLGVVLYEMLAGHPPFSAESPVALAFKHVRESPAPPSSLNAALGPEVDAVVLRAMAKDPAHRYASAEEFGRAIHGLRTGPGEASAPTDPVLIEPTAALPGPVAAAPLPVAHPPPASHPGSRRRRWPFVIAASIVLVALAVTAGFLVGGWGRPATGGSPSASTPGTQPTTPASPAVPTSLSVGQAAAALEQLVQAGEDQGEIDHHSANEIQHGASEAVKRYEQGRLDDALQTLSDLQGTIADLADEGAIGSSDLADQLDQAVGDLASAMEGGPPSPGNEGN